MSDQRPSFVVYVTDQHRADFMSCAGHPVLQTPNIDALAARGLLFKRFYVASPVCMPNRASLMTCRMPSSHGVRMNGIPLDTREVSFVDLLRDAGYETALIGKSHLQNFSRDAPMMKPPSTRDGYHRAGPPLLEAYRQDYDVPPYLFEQRDYHTPMAEHAHGSFYGFDHVEIVTSHGDFCNGEYREWLLEREPNAAQLVGAANQLPHDYVCPQAVRTSIPEELYSTTYIAERAEAWIRERDPASKQPFFLMVSWPDPHHPFNPPGKYWDLYKPDDMPTPAAFARDDWEPPVHVSGILAEREAGMAQLQGMGSVGCSAREAREAQALTCGMIAMIDDAIGCVDAAVDECNRGQQVVKVFTSDHGDHLGDHKLLFKGAEQYEQLTRVPFIWADPDGPTGERTHALGQTLDIGRTILERAHVEPAVGMEGQVLPPLADDGRESAFIQYEHQKVNPGIGPQPRVYSIRHGDWRLSLIHGVEVGELYNLADDPGEFQNRWTDAQASTIKGEMRGRLARAHLDAVVRAPIPVHKA